MKKIKKFVKKYADFTKVGLVCFLLVLVCFIVCLLSLVFHPDINTWGCMILTLCILIFVYFAGQDK